VTCVGSCCSVSIRSQHVFLIQACVTLWQSHRKTSLFWGHDVDMITDPGHVSDMCLHSEMIKISCQKYVRSMSELLIMSTWCPPLIHAPETGCFGYAVPHRSFAFQAVDSQ